MWIAVVVGGWLLAEQYWPESSTVISGDLAGAEAGADWPLFRGNLARTGYAGGPDPRSGQVNWTYSEPGVSYLASPAVVGNRIYMTTAKIEWGGGSGAVVCLDADTGEELWRTVPGEYEATFSSASIAGEHLVVGEGLHTTVDAKVVCISLAPGREGQIEWIYQTASHVESTPVIHNGRVYVGAGDKEGYYCFDLKGDGQGGPKVIWHQYGPDYLDAETSLVPYKDRLYAGLGNDGKAIVEFDAATGEELRRLEMPYPIFSPPAIVDGKMYVGSGNGDFAMTAAQLDLPTEGQLAKIDIETLQPEWQIQLPDTVLGSPAVKDGRVYVGCRDGKLYCYSTKGQLIRSWETGSEIVTSPAVAERTVYVLSRGGTLEAFDTESGQAVWEVVVGNPPGPNQFGFISSPTVARGRVYMGTQSDGFVCAGQPGGGSRPIWSSARGGLLQGVLNDMPLPSPAVMSADPWPADNQYDPDAPAVPAAPALMGQRVLAPLANMGERNGLACLEVGGQMREEWHYPVANGFYRTPALLGTDEGALYRVVAIDGRPGQTARKLHCLGPDKETLWTEALADDSTGYFSISQDHVFAQLQVGKLTCLTLEGDTVWTSQTGNLVTDPLIEPNMVLLAVTGTDGPEVLALDRLTGRLLGRWVLKAQTVHDLRTHGQFLYAVTDAGLVPIDLAVPEPPGDPTGLPAATAASFVEGEAWLVSAEGKLTRCELATGKVTQFGPASKQAAPILLPGKVVYISPQGEPMRLDRGESASGQAQPVCTEDMSALGSPADSPVAANGRLLVPYKTMGLCVFGGMSE
ncbi:MAG: PQQ-binding-like beta-propeller repeat protein [Phycisphaerae bacterium]